MAHTVRVQTEDFNAGLMYEALVGDPKSGAVVTFSGLVRDDSGTLQALELEHYPPMTEKALEDIVAQAAERWPLQHSIVVHRVGYLRVNEQIVYVGVASGHRQAAFEAASFIMDYLKTRAPFWKKEHYTDGSHWVEAKHSDNIAAARWKDKDTCGDSSQ